VGILKRSSPIPQGFVHCILQGPITAFDRDHFGAVELHLEHIGRFGGGYPPLPCRSRQGKPKLSADRRGGHTVLTGTGLGDDPGLPQALGQESLPDGVVDLMRSGVGQAFQLDVDVRTADFLSRVLRE
jgi:hypothetical protein